MDTKKIDALKIKLLDEMRDYMASLAEDGDEPAYGETDVQTCDTLIDGFLAKVRAATPGDDKTVMKEVRKVVESLNKLNEKCDYSLIKTEQRELLAETIIQSAAAMGVGDGKEDITEEWREW